MTFVDLYKNCRKLYFYIKRRRNIPMIDDLPPTKVEVSRAVQKLGFKVKNIQSTKFKKEIQTLEINLSKKNPEWKILLALSYYSNTLIQSIKIDSVISKLLVCHHASKKQTKMTIESLTEKIITYRNLVRYEFIVRLENPIQELVEDRL